MLFEILTGRPPYEGRTVPDVICQVAYAPPPLVHTLCPDAPTELCAIVTKALQREEEQRYESATQLAEDISAFMTGRCVHAHEYSSWELVRRFAAPNKLALAAAATILLVIVVSLVVVLVAWRRESEARLRSAPDPNCA